jgi:hypothetical protein
MRSIGHILILLFSLAAIASAGAENVTIGQFRIDFDPGTDLNYSVEAMPPLEEDNYTSYTTLIDVADKTRVGIYIFDLKTREDATLKTRITAYKLISKYLENASVKIDEIDGKECIFITYENSSKNKKHFEYLYWPDSEVVPGSDVSIGAIEVRVFGSMPLNSSHGMAIAESIRNTLHIEKFASHASSEVESVAPVAAQAATPAIEVAPRPSPYIKTHDQDAASQGGVVMIDEAFSDGPGWVVVFNEKDNPFLGPVYTPAGQAHLNDGLNKNIPIKLNMAGLTPKLYTALYRDEDVKGNFESNGKSIFLNPSSNVHYSFRAISPYDGMALESPDWSSFTSDPILDWR